MKKPKLTDEEFDQLLEEAKPDLQAMRRNSPPITPERIEELKNKLEKIHPFVRVLTAKQMESLLLKVLAEKSMTGFDIAERLEKANIKLKEGGEGVLYGLLAKLESAGCVHGEWRESGDRMIKIYRSTEKGTGSLREAGVAAAHLNAWSEAVLSFS
jgi:DNA-binding PadR family transcriptional regulator